MGGTSDGLLVNAFGPVPPCTCFGFFDPTLGIIKYIFSYKAGTPLTLTYKIPGPSPSFGAVDMHISICRAESYFHVWTAGSDEHRYLHPDSGSKPWHWVGIPPCSKCTAERLPCRGKACGTALNGGRGDARECLLDRGRSLQMLWVKSMHQTIWQKKKLAIAN